MSYGIIYKATNKVNGKVYIGQTKKTLRTRMKEHFAQANKDTARKGYFQRALKRYGENGFSWDVIDTADSAEELNEKEEDWIIHYGSYGDNGYNLTPGGNQSSMKGQTVYVFTLDGSFLSEHDSHTETAMAYKIALSRVTSVVNGKSPSHAGKVFLRAEDFDNMKEMFKEVHRRHEQERILKYRKYVVVGVDAEGEAHFCPSIFEMEKKTGISLKTILDSCEGKVIKSTKWTFCWAIDFKSREPEAYIRYNERTAKEMMNLYYQYQPE